MRQTTPLFWAYFWGTVLASCALNALGHTLAGSFATGLWVLFVAGNTRRCRGCRGLFPEVSMPFIYPHVGLCEQCTVTAELTGTQVDKTND
jgi:hypothetical protein